jgi:hypothetical protein
LDSFQVSTPVVPVIVCETVIAQVAVLFPSCVFARMVAVPSVFVVTSPFAEMDATAVLLHSQLTVLFEAFEGDTVAVNCSVVPGSKKRLVLLKDIPVTGIVGIKTVTSQLVFLLPSAVVTVMVAVPLDIPVTNPVDKTVATDGALLVQVISLFVALAGNTVAINCSVESIAKERPVLFNDTPVTGIVGVVTVTSQLAFLLPSTVVTAMVAVPFAILVTNPVDETVATDGVLLVQVTSLFVALAGSMVAVNCSVAPVSKARLVLFNDTPVMEIVGIVTVTSQVVFFLPSAVVTVMVVVPFAMPVTNPVDETVATGGALLSQVTSLFVALAGNIVAVNCSVAPVSRARLVLFNDTPVTAIDKVVTVTSQAVFLLPSTVVTVMIAEPFAILVTNPVDETVATDGALLTQVTSLFVALVGNTVTVNCSVAPVSNERFVLFNDTSVTAIGRVVTFTLQVTFILPSMVVAVMVARPSDRPVTNPVDETVATDGELLSQLTSLFDAFEGNTVAFSCSVFPTDKVNDVLFNNTLLTGTPDVVNNICSL